MLAKLKILFLLIGLVVFFGILYTTTTKLSLATTDCYPSEYWQSTDFRIVNPHRCGNVVGTKQIKVESIENTGTKVIVIFPLVKRN